MRRHSVNHITMTSLVGFLTSDPWSEPDNGPRPETPRHTHIRSPLGAAAPVSHARGEAQEDGTNLHGGVFQPIHCTVRPPGSGELISSHRMRYR
jgi:hypothetical protein